MSLDTTTEPQELHSGLDEKLASELEQHVCDGLERWQAENRATIVLSRWLDGGHTAAKVAAVAINYAEDLPPRKIVLKICPPAPHTAREPERHAAALEAGPAEFVRDHLVEQPHPPFPLSDGAWILFQEIAGGDLRAYRPLSALHNNTRLPELCAAIVGSALGAWNPKPVAERMSARDCLVRQLERRALPGGPLDAWASKLGSAGDETWIRFAHGEPPCANPIAWMRDESVPAPELMVLCGNAHGDLHLGNVFVRMRPAIRSESHRLIDLSAFSTQAPLAHDPLHLLLATIGQHLPNLQATQRTALADHLLSALDDGADGVGTLQLQGLERLVAAVLGAGDGWASQLSMADDWREQLWLGMVGAALVQASVWALPEADRWWFYQLASKVLTRYLAASERAEARVGEALIVRSPSDRMPVVMDAAARLDELAGGFDGSKTMVAVLSEDGGAPPALARQPWSLVVEFDPLTDKGGAFSRAQAGGRHVQRMVTFGQEPSFGRSSTTWFAAAGLDGLEPVPAELRAWRADCLPQVEHVFGTLARSSTKPVCICVLGTVSPRVRMVVEDALDVLQARAEIVVASERGADELAAYEVVELPVDAAELLDALPERLAESLPTHEVTLPGQDGLVTVPEDQRLWVEEIGELLHSDAGRASERPEALAEEFYRGNRITWLELDLDVDIPRRLTDRLLERVREDLGKRHTRRISLHHYPGAGGTTVARRVAWDLHAEYPTLVVERLTDHVPLVSRVLQLNAMTDRAVLVVVESTLDAVLERTYSALRADSVPAILLIVDRLTTAPEDRRDRTFYLGELKPAEREDFVRRFAERVPERRVALRELSGTDPRTSVPFFFGLVAYGEEYVGLSRYVARTIETIGPAERSCLSLISLVHRYAGMALPAELLARILEVPPTVPVELGTRIHDATLALVVEQRPGEWRTLHWLIAEELLHQLLAAPDAAASANDWKVSLSTLAVRLIEEAHHEFDAHLPDDVITVLDQLFIVRESQSALGTERTTFSELLSDIPSLPGRLGVMQQLASTFPHESRFWAHLGRMLSYAAEDHREALEAVDRALALAPEDDTVSHIRGMVLRNQVRQLIRDVRRSHDHASEREVLELIDAARAEFRRSNELSDDREHGHVSLVQLCMMALEFGKERSEEATYAAFLARPESGYYRELLAEAEDSLDRVREIRGGDAPSKYHAAAEANLHELYDDFAAMLNGWWNLLDRPDLAKPPIRRRIVRAYLNRARSWRNASRADREKAVELLDANLRDNPRDVGSLLEWLRVARFEHRSLDRAAELVSYSAAAYQAAPRDVAYYDYVLAALLALEGRESAAREYRRKLERSRERAGAFENRRFVYEWYGRGEGLARLVHHSELRDWSRSREDPDPPSLCRVEGRVALIRRPQSGEIEFGPGMRAFFTPAVAGLVAGRDENVRVSFLLGFSYESAQAWRVERLDVAQIAAEEP
jgi:tetratricopeptide (TPR) repeat protein